MAAKDQDWMDGGADDAPATMSRPLWATPAAERVREWQPGAPVAEPPPEAPVEPATSSTPPPPRVEVVAPAPAEPVHTFDDAQLAELEATIVGELREPYLASARSLAAAVNELEQRLYDDVVDLAVRLAEAVVHRTVALDRAILLENTRRALRLAGPVSRMTLKCAEEDAPFLREEIDEAVRSEVGRAIEVTVRPSADIDIGGCLLTFDSGIVDARIPQQLKRLADAVKAALHDTAARRAAGEPGGDAAEATAGVLGDVAPVDDAYLDDEEDVR